MAKVPEFFTARQATKRVANNEARFAWAVRWNDASESRYKFDRAECVALVEANPELAGEIVAYLATSYASKVHSHNNAVGAQIFVPKKFARFTPIR